MAPRLGGGDTAVLRAAEERRQRHRVELAPEAAGRKPIQMPLSISCTENHEYNIPSGV
jgi:hypothetical protein